MVAAVPPSVPTVLFQFLNPSKQQRTGQPSLQLSIPGHGSHLSIPGVFQQHRFPSSHSSQMSVPGPARINSNSSLAVPGPIPRRTDGRVSNFLLPSDLAWDAEWLPRCLCQSLMAEKHVLLSEPRVKNSLCVLNHFHYDVIMAFGQKLLFITALIHVLNLKRLPYPFKNKKDETQMLAIEPLHLIECKLH